MRDLISLRETTVEDIHRVLETAAAFKEILRRPVKKVPTLRGRSVITLFYESSTRTRTSFELAAKYMSADAVNISVAQSSVTKGESLKDTFRTLQSLTAKLGLKRADGTGIVPDAFKVPTPGQPTKVAPVQCPEPGPPLTAFTGTFGTCTTHTNTAPSTQGFSVGAVRFAPVSKKISAPVARLMSAPTVNTPWVGARSPERTTG